MTQTDRAFEQAKAKLLLQLAFPRLLGTKTVAGERRSAVRLSNRR
jgi:hypothetical protein